MKLLPKRQGFKKEAMAFAHNRLIKEDLDSDSFRESIIASTKETSSLII